ncbi:MAG: TonB-dependent receptor [Gemmatimonadaceae bacterium]
MIATLAMLLLQQAIVAGTVVEAGTGLPVASVLLSAPSGDVRSDASGRFTLRAAPGDSIHARRVGYRPIVAVVAGPEVIVQLTSVALSLDPIAVTDARQPARLHAERSVAEARARGASSLPDLVQRLPFVTSRSGRGGTVLSMRGSRPEQVVVTLDGLPLTDPATGIADISDIPLIALGSVAASPGAAAASYGGGASGGVLALNTGDRSAISLTASSFHRRGAEAAARFEAWGGSLRLAGSWQSERNNFPFVNEFTATSGAGDSTERRVNADEQRAGLVLSAVFPRLHIVALGTALNRGLPGPMNVRIYDDVRQRSRRVLLRIGTSSGEWAASAGARLLDVSVRDPRNPAMDHDAQSLSVDVDVSRAIGRVTVRAGAGLDRVRATSLVPAERARGFVSASRNWERGRYRLRIDARADAVQTAGIRVSPSIGVERAGAATLFIRAGRGFRAPTFYDLYFASPQRVIARDVRPERVVLDAEAGVRVEHGLLAASASIFERRTHNAIVWFPGTFDWSPRNVPRERVRGVEAVLRLGGPRLAIESWGAVHDTRLFVDGIHIPTPYVPRMSGTLRADARVARFALSAEVAALGRRPYRIAPSAPENDLPPVVLLSADVSCSVSLLGADALVTAGIRNATNVRWQPVRRYPSPGRTWTAGLVVYP